MNEWKSQNGNWKKLKNIVVFLFFFTVNQHCDKASAADDSYAGRQTSVSENKKFTVNFFKRQKQYKDLVTQNSDNAYTNLYIDLNGGEYSMEGSGDETGIEIEIDGIAFVASRGTKKMSSRINYQLIGNDKTLISDGSATVLTSTHANQTSLGIKKEFKSDRLHSSSIGVRLTEEKGQREVASTIDLGLLTSDTSRRSTTHHHALSVIQEMSFNIAPALFFELGFERTKTLNNEGIRTLSAGSFFGLKIKPFQTEKQHPKQHLIPSRKYLLSVDFGEANAVPSGVFRNSPGNYDAVTKYHGIIPIKSTTQQITLHNQISTNSAIRFSAQKKKTSGTVKSSKLALSFLSGNAFQLEADMNMNETRAGLEYERVITKSHNVETFGIFGIFAGLVDLKLTEKETLPNSTSQSSTSSNSPIGGISVGFGQRFWTSEKTFFAFENKFNLYDGEPFDVSHQINEFTSQIKIGMAF
jgi:hypothetical protein